MNHHVLHSSHAIMIHDLLRRTSRLNQSIILLHVLIICVIQHQSVHPKKHE
jgi:hypothetical protein